MRQYSKTLFWALILLGCSTGRVLGQAREKRFEFPFRSEIRLRSELRANYDLRSARDDDNYPLLTRLRFSLAPRWKSVSLLAQFQDSSAWFREKSPYSSANAHLYQLHLEVPVPYRFRLKVGRQELVVGEERLLGAFAWDNRGRVFDAFSLSRKVGEGSLQIFASNLAAPRQRNFARGQNLFGLVWKQTEKAKTLEAYSLWLHDQRVLKGEERSGRTRILTSGIRLVRQPGHFKQNVEVAFQVGKRAQDTHLAAAFTYRGDYSWDGVLKPTLGAEYSFATGDGNASDGRSHEFHNLYPTNHPFYGYMDLFGWRNLHDPRVIFAVQPSKSSRLEAGYHDFWLVRSRGAWKDAGGRVLGQDASGRSGRRVAGEADLLATYTFTPHWRFLFGYSAFLPGKFARATRGEGVAQFGYLQLVCSY